MKIQSLCMWGILVGALISLVVLSVRSRLESFQSIEPQKPHKTVHIIRGNQEYVSLSLEVVNTPQALEQGLMFRTSLPPNTGMLFEFSSEAPRGFWMRNTLIPLDMLFIKEDGRIATIHANTTPKSDQLYNSTEPVRSVIEVPGGTVGRVGIRLGDMVVSR